MNEQTKHANPGPLGLLGFGMATILLNLHNEGILGLSVVVVSMGFALGGAAQVIAGILEFKNGNTFGGTAFTAYGLFWWSLVLIWMNPSEMISAPDGKSMGFYLLLWAIFTLFLYVCTLKHNRATQIVFLTLTILFAGLAIGNFSGVAMITIISGWIGILCGASAIYNAMAQVINEEYGKTILPL